MVDLKVGWNKPEENSLIGTAILRIDGYEKATGAAKYASDTNTAGTLYAKVLTSPHGMAKLSSIKVQDAEKVPGVEAVHLFANVGDELKWEGALVAAVAATRPEYADDGLRALQAMFEPLEHFVDEADLDGAVKANRTKDNGEKTKGDLAAAFAAAKVVHEGEYGVSTITHMCLEPHGSHCEWTKDGNLVANLSTQNVSGTAGQFAGPLEIEASKVSIICNYIGGGFGSKFAADEWGVAAARMAKQTGKPVRLMLDRATEMKIAGNRPSAFAKIKVGADADGKIIAWESHHWGTDGLTGNTVPIKDLPYVFQPENVQHKATGIITNCGPKRAWRAPNHPQLCALTDTAIDDIARKLGKNSYDVFLANLSQTPRQDVYRAEMEIAARMIDWKAKWHPHGKGGAKNGVVRGVGMALHTWPGVAVAASCKVKVNPDGSIESFAGSQDIGTGTRTVIATVLAETFGVDIADVRVHIGNNSYPYSNPSGGSTTVGSVSGANRRAGIAALGQLFDKVAEKYKIDGSKLSAKKKTIWLGDKAVCSWKEATALLGIKPLEVQGESPADDGLTSSGVGGVQMADVSVDTETGKIRVNQLVAVQDCGLVISLETAKSQVYGALIMGIAYALSEERIMDNTTGRFINADLQNYKLPRIGDIGELMVEMYRPESETSRGVIGLGEPPVISTGAAISNAVCNALGVRVSQLPMIPKRVLDALEGARA